MLDLFALSALLIILGLGAGTLASMIGVGGGLIMTPALTLIGFAPVQISSTSLFAVTFTSASSTISYAKQKKIHYRVGLKMAAAAIPGAIIGAFISSIIAIEPFKIYFGILLMLAGIYIAYNSSFTKGRQNGPTGNNRRSVFLRPLFYSGALSAGIISSLFGVGGGIIFVPLLVLVLGMTLTTASPISQIALLITSFVGTVTHAVLGHPDYFHAASLSAGAIVGGQIGAKISDRIKESLLRKILSILLIAVALKFISDFIGHLSHLQTVT
ncbi:MAG TPA: sulfite exporter TauE/SafE family protein [Candidatus Nitrosopolaris sp.]|nr:sulfite exporter TauE/SafE family protein [Candidatus Nitrosopolaris sp.]